jgi:hypothetical protein
MIRPSRIVDGYDPSMFFWGVIVGGLALTAGAKQVLRMLAPGLFGQPWPRKGRHRG